MNTIVENNDKTSHFEKLKDLSVLANRLVLVSPFLAPNLNKFLDEMPTIKNIEVYTNIYGFSQEVSVIESLKRLYDCCDKKRIKLSIKYSNELHGKTYLFYKDEKPLGFITTSANFTKKGLKNNLELGIKTKDDNLQKQMYKKVASRIHKEIGIVELNKLFEEVKEYKEKIKGIKIPKFKPSSKYTKQNLPKSYFMKSVGRKGDFIKEEAWNDKEIGFSKPICQKGDYLVINAIGHSKIVAICEIIDAEPEQRYDFADDKWPYKYKIKCFTKEFSKNWWIYNLKPKALEKSFNKVKKTNDHIHNDSDSIGILSWGRPFEITHVFFKYVLKQMENYSKTKIKL